MSNLSSPYRRPGEHAQVLRTRIRALQTYPSGALPFDALRRSAELRPVPSRPLLEQLLDIAFFATLENEEGNPTQFSLAFAPMRSFCRLRAPGMLRFAESEELTVRSIRKLAPAFDPWTTSLAVTRTLQGFRIWGALTVPPSGTPDQKRVLPCVTIRGTQPGLLEIGSGDTEALFTGGQLDFNVEEFEAAHQISKSLGVDVGAAIVLSVFRIARAARRIGHGGTIVVLNDSGAATMQSDPEQLNLNADRRFTPPNSILSEATSSEANAALARSRAFGPLRGGACDRGGPVRPCSEATFAAAVQDMDHAIALVAQLTAIDGAVVIDTEHRIHAFGAFFAPGPDLATVLRIRYGSKPSIVRLAEVGGSRHRSACKWVAQHGKDGIAVVVSQDGDASLVAMTTQGVAVVGPLPMSRDPNER